MNNPNRIEYIDGLRGIAALAVFMVHMTSPNLQKLLGGSNEIPIRIGWGGYGVEMLFIISGYVISMTLYRKQNVRQFAKARFKRLYPTFWLCLLVSTLVTMTIFPGDFKLSFGKFLVNLTMIPNQFIQHGYIEGPYWTLEVEIFFYCIVGFVFYFLSPSLMLPALAISTALGVIWVGFDFSGWLVVRSEFFAGLCGRIAGWLIVMHMAPILVGAALYAWDQTRQKGFLIYLLFGLLCSVLTSYKEGLVVICLTTLFRVSRTGPLEKFLTSRYVLLIGGVSYPFYLLHDKLGKTVIVSVVNISGNYWVGLILAFSAVLVVSHNINKLSEYLLKV